MSPMVLWASLALLLVWQAMLTAMILRGREEAEPAEHRLGRVAAAMSEVVEQFDRVAKRRLSDLDERRGTARPRPAARRVRRTCETCSGHGFLECLEPDPAEGPDEAVRAAEVGWEAPRPSIVPNRVGARPGAGGGR